MGVGGRGFGVREEELKEATSGIFPRTAEVDESRQEIRKGFAEHD